MSCDIALWRLGEKPYFAFLKLQLRANTMYC